MISFNFLSRVLWNKGLSNIALDSTVSEATALQRSIIDKLQSAVIFSGCTQAKTYDTFILNLLMHFLLQYICPGCKVTTTDKSQPAYYCKRIYYILATASDISCMEYVNNRATSLLATSLLLAAIAILLLVAVSHLLFILTLLFVTIRCVYCTNLRCIYQMVAQEIKAETIKIFYSTYCCMPAVLCKILNGIRIKQRATKVLEWCCSLK